MASDDKGVSSGVESGPGGSDSTKSCHFSNPSGSTTAELDLENPIPEYLERFADFEKGESFYMNWKTGEKVTEDPRKITEAESEDLNSEVDSKRSSSEISASSEWKDKRQRFMEEQNVLVAVGCKSCLMYKMVPYLSKDCPRCHGPLVRF